MVVVWQSGQSHRVLVMVVAANLLTTPGPGQTTSTLPHNLPIFKIIGFLWEAGNILTERTLYSS